ncbi:hypothetical protein ACHAWU_009585 [Discostella pseudostelligera]|uniref:Uncharacterized protein n=1 Tax=Discostella pseudostelligera TaxID=259834 RepID=A0ABD3MA50_9STRA
MAMSAFTLSSAVVKRYLSSSLSRGGCARFQLGVGSSNFELFAPRDVSQNASRCWKAAAHCTNTGGDLRQFSTIPTPPPPFSAAATAANNNGFTPTPPTSLTPEACLSAQNAMKLFIEHGLGKQKLQAIASEKKQHNTPLVDRWQKMVAVYLETQCHVIALLGYAPDERGIALYTQHLSQAVSLSSPEIQDKIRVSGRDTYRMVLAGAFDIPTLLSDQLTNGEVSVVDARNIMHKVSLRMHDPELLEKVAKRCAGISSVGNSPETQAMEMARKHAVVQEVMVSDVYLSKDNNGVTLVQECGFGDGEEGYVRMQSAMAEHQGDPLITQYVGSAIMKLLQSAGIDMEALQKQAMSMQA